MWTAKVIPREFVSAEFLYDISKRHGLLHARPAASVANLLTTARDAEVYTMYAGDEHVATLILSRITPGWAGECDLIPVHKFFRGHQSNNLRDAARPILLDAMDRHELLRLTAWVPVSRARAVRALQSCGFQIEGTMRRAVQLNGKEPEDLIVLGLTKE